MSGDTEEEAAAGGHGRRGGPWVNFGMELCGLGLGSEEEAALDSHSKMAMAAARVVRIRDSSIIVMDDEAALDGHSSRFRAAPSSWVGFGLELSKLGLTSDEEAMLDPQSQVFLTSIAEAPATVP